MKLIITIDVEEEGLFCGRYDQDNPSVENVPCLRQLDPVFSEMDIHPTLLVTYPVARNNLCGDLLCDLKERWKAEIGAHLHTWNTPPFVSLPCPAPVPSELIPSDLLLEKLDTLLGAIRNMGILPLSFRMGRFNMGPRMFSALAQTSICVDSSIAPMRRYYGGPDHLDAPTDPYFPDPGNPCIPGNSQVLEVPLTILPIYRGLGSHLNFLTRFSSVPGSWISWFAMFLGSWPIQPMWTGLGRLKAAATIHRLRHGTVLNISFHSSELMPGGSPKSQTPKQVHGFLRKLERFLSWLKNEKGVQSMTLSELDEDCRQRGTAP